MRRKEALEWAAAVLIVLVGLSLWILLLQGSLERNFVSNCMHPAIQTAPKENP